MTKPLSLAPEEVSYVADKRRCGYPNSAIARMIGRHIDQVRAVPVVVIEPPPEPRRISSMCIHDQIISRVAAEHDLDFDDIVGPRLDRRVTRARHHAMAELHALGTYHLRQISDFLGRKDHTTIIHGVRAHHERLECGEAPPGKA